MNNKDLMQQLQLCVNEYKKLQIENERLLKENEEQKQQLANMQSNTSSILSCVKESDRVVKNALEDLKEAEEVIEGLRGLIDYYEKATVMMFQELDKKVDNIMKKNEGIEEIKKEIEKTKEDLINLNNMIL